MPTKSLPTSHPALCFACGEKATLSIYSRIWDTEITACRRCVEDAKGKTEPMCGDHLLPIKECGCKI
jgi:hypothetical protein